MIRLTVAGIDADLETFANNALQLEYLVRRHVQRLVDNGTLPHETEATVHAFGDYFDRTYHVPIRRTPQVMPPQLVGGLDAEAEAIDILLNF